MLWLVTCLAAVMTTSTACLQSVEQVAFADVILLNKNDLVSVGERKRITARIKVQI